MAYLLKKQYLLTIYTPVACTFMENNSTIWECLCKAGKGQSGTSTLPLELPTSVKAAGIQKGSATGRKGPSVGKITRAQLRQIAEYKLPDLNCDDIEAAMRIVEGSANNMGIVVVD